MENLLYALAGILVLMILILLGRKRRKLRKFELTFKERQASGDAESLREEDNPYGK